MKLILITALLLAPLAGLVNVQTKAPAKSDLNFIASPAELEAPIPKLVTTNGMARLVELTCSVNASNHSQTPAKRFVFRVTIPPSGLVYQQARTFPVPRADIKAHKNGVDHYMEFDFPVPGSSRVTHEIKSHVLLLPMDYTCQKPPANPRDAGVTTSLSPSKLVESDAPEIVAVARQIFSGKTTDLEKAKTAYEYSGALIRFRPQQPAGALKALQTRSGDCTEFAALFCALCRAGSVPARMTGVFNMASKTEMTCEEPNHNSAEAFLDGWGWAPVDANLGGGKFNRPVGFAKTGNSVILLTRAGAWVWSTWLPPDASDKGEPRPEIKVEVSWKMRVLRESPSAQMLLDPRAAQLHAAAPAKPDPNFIASPAELKARIAKELRITRPDYVVFVPEVAEAGASDTGNEHFLVCDAPDGSLMAVWTQSSVENYSPDTPPDQHIAFSRSGDEGKNWSKPRIIAGPKKAGDGYMASWAYPLVSKKGRIYVLYSQHIGKFDSFLHHTGWLHGICSDDNGATWSQPQNIPVARSINDNPDATMPPNMLCWQKPLRLGKDGRYLAGFTRWTSFAVRKPVPEKNLGSADSRVEFMRFENVDDNPEPRDLKISWFMSNEKALAVPYPKAPQNSVCQEPSIVKLPDGRLFCVMRTSAGSPFWTSSADQGETWTPPRPLLRKDGGEPLRHPVSPCPIYDVGGNEAGSGRYVLFIHDNDGQYKGYKPNPPVTGFNRRPVYLVAGRFQPGADQPVWFDEQKLFMDHDNVSLGKPGTSGRFDLSLYASFTVRGGKPVLWYPDRKFFLLGRIIGSEWFAPTADPATDWKRSRPDVTVYLPKEGEHHDGDNEMFIVFKAPKSDELLGMWTQSSVEGRGDNRIMLARSADGVEWSGPQRIAGTAPGTKEPQASWGVPIVARTGRIYCIYLKEKPRAEAGQKQESGGMGCLYSDDNGKTWQPGPDIAMPRNRFDHPDPAIPKSYWLWTTTAQDRRGRHLLGYTTTTSQAVKTWPSKLWVHKDSRCAFARFENIDEGPDPKDLKVAWLPADREGLEVPNRVFPDMSVAQEPCVVLLPDGRLLVALRTMAGAVWYSVSDDDGATWRTTEPLRYRDGGDPIPQPLAPAPIYPLADGRFVLVFHNNDGTHGDYSQWKTKWTVNQANYIRNPAYIAVGEFRPKAHQPIWFSAPKQILDTQGVIVGPKKTAEIATYPSLTEWRGQRVLWYPDRKYYLLGKYLPDELLAGMKAPTADGP